MGDVQAKPRRETGGGIASEEDIQKAVNWLRDQAEAIGEAKTRAVNASNMLKHIEALEYLNADGKSDGMRKAQARASQRYKDAAYEEAVAHGELAKLYSLREAASTKIEAWQTWCANYRGIRV